MEAVFTKEGQTNQVQALKATTVVENILLFGLPGLGLYISFYWFSPWLAQWMALSEARMIGGSLVMLSLLIAAWIGFLREGHPVSWAAFAARFRINRMDRRTWLWTVGSMVVYVLLVVAANNIAPMLFKAVGFTPPIETAEPWGLSALPLVIIGLALNILGEEIWWRGYVLPRQEKQFGQLAWLWHGVMWAFFHYFKWWTIPALLFVCPVVPFVAQKTKNTIPGIISHLLVNGLGIVVTVIGLLTR